MKIFFYVNGMPFDGDTLHEIKNDKGETIKPAQSLGGSETMGLMLAEGLAKRGHSVFCFSNVPDGKVKTIRGVTYMPIGESTKEFPFGVNFQHHARNVPCDVLLAQRVPGIFADVYASKLNYWWTHDLALKRYEPQLNAGLWGTDRIFAVSEWHRQQIMAVYDIHPDYISVLPNGIDLDLYKPGDPERKVATKTMLYSSRPERGLINLVRPDGIMEQLFRADPEIQLYVCTYEHYHPSMENEYRYLYQRCNQLPNVKNIGNLNKASLAQVMRKCWLHVYPTEFEETSCITAMEQQASGTPFVATKAGALPETLSDAGAYWVDGDIVEGTVKAVTYLAENPDKWRQLNKRAVMKAAEYGIDNSIDDLEASIDADFDKLTADKRNLYRHFVYYSDASAAGRLAEAQGLGGDDLQSEFPTAGKTVEQTVDFYESQAAYHRSIANTHSLGNYDAILATPRIRAVRQELGRLPEGSKVLDFGCCVGQNTFALAHEFPHLLFTGIDISASQIEVASVYRDKNDIRNVQLHCGKIESRDYHEYDAVIATEVLEHVWEYKYLLEELEFACKIGGRMMISTPHGPHDRNVPDRTMPIEHVHHFEEQDVIDLVGGKPNFNLIYSRDPDNYRGDKLGTLIWLWDADHKPAGEIDYRRKFSRQRPRQSLSCCMIVSPDGDTLGKTIKSLKSIVDEWVIGIDSVLDEKTPAERVIDRLIPGATVFRLCSSPQVQGFADARNETIEYATCDWILWIDDDETWQYPERVLRYLRNNQFDSYAIHQHHFTGEPPSVMKTDLPCRLFRNNKKIRFHGLVHEHPETAINEGAGKSFLIPHPYASILHAGYDNEQVRRARFVRNWPLMVRERDVNPDRLLGKFLWIRDLGHKNRFDMERNGGKITDEIMGRAQEAVDIWRDLLENGTTRLIVESLPYVSECFAMANQNRGIRFRFALDTSTHGFGDDMNHAPQMIDGFVANQADLDKLMTRLSSDKVGQFFDQKYL
jgi:glycosyltransferase involved in cell wall biosynthesis/2-polyprenyl-3-methyl-5-hydroxy-6-metoxy-1,4-benzoquinol methylase